MNTHMIIEIIGYIGSALVLISFLMVSVFKLRVVNSIGSVVCVIYGLIIHAYPTVVMNLCLVAINVYYLIKMSNTEKSYDLVRVNGDEGLTKYTIDLYKDDIAKCFPGISMNFEDSNCGFVVCQNGKPAGVMLGTLDDGCLDIMLDYSTPEYRDFSIGKFLISSLGAEGIKKLVFKGPSEHHKEYLSQTGFTEKDGYYEKVL